MSESVDHTDPDSRQREELEAELLGLNNLLSVAQVVVSSLELDEVLQNILFSAMGVMDMPAGSIALYDEQASYLQLHAHAGLSDKFVAKSRWRVKRNGLTHRILDEGELFIVNDTTEVAFFNNPIAVNEGIRALIAVPLKIQNRIIGILYLDAFEPRRFEERRLRLLAILASFATMSIDNARLHQRMRELACTDGLTGIYNHRQFRCMFREEMLRARRYQKPLALIMLDIDDFKKFNDRYGHPNGDRVLVLMANTLRDCLRGYDMTFRYGGEEFIAILPECAHEKAVEAAERIRVAIEDESRRFLAGICDHGVTVSVGVATYPRDGADEDALLLAVDKLMYQAKACGKNKVYQRTETN